MTPGNPKVSNSTTKISEQQQQQQKKNSFIPNDQATDKTKSSSNQLKCVKPNLYVGLYIGSIVESEGVKLFPTITDPSR